MSNLEDFEKEYLARYSHLDDENPPRDPLDTTEKEVSLTKIKI